MRDTRDGFGPPPFAGRHTRFHYNSEGEIDSVQVDEEEDMEKSPEGNIAFLKLLKVNCKSP
jgi:hypothetical protein